MIEYTEEEFRHTNKPGNIGMTLKQFLDLKKWGRKRRISKLARKARRATRRHKNHGYLH